MLRGRKYFNGKKRISDFWWILAILAFILTILLPITLTNAFTGTFNLFLFIIVSVPMMILIIVRIKDRQKVYHVPYMSKYALKRARHVKKLFKDSVLAENLRMGVLTRYGVMIPSISVWIAENLDTGALFVENIGAFEKLERLKLIESISGILSDPYECVSSSIVSGGDFVRFDFEDTKTSHRFIIKNNDLKLFLDNDVHSLRLSDDLIWNARKVPHASVIGRTGSGKTIFVGGYMAKLAYLQGWKVIYASVKPDKFTKEYHGPTTPEQITNMAEQLVKFMQRRLVRIQKAGVNDYGEIKGMHDVAFFIDEIGHLNALLSDNKKLKIRFENAMKSLSFTGRSAGIHLIGVSQFATIEAFFPSAVRGNMKDCVIMLGGSANSGEERKFLIPGYSDFAQRSYSLGEGVALVLGAGKKWEKPHYFATPFFES